MPIAPARHREDGFSLIEALVVLAVAGMALMLVFAAASRATQAAFGLGRLALGAADGEVADDGFRVLVAGMQIAPGPAAQGRLDDVRFEGRPEAFRGTAVLARAGACAGAGPAGVVEVELVGRADGDVVVCRGGGEQAVLLELKTRAAFAYSEDGRVWSARWTDAPVFGASASLAPRRSRRLFVRLAGADGRTEIVAVTDRARPEAAPAPPAPEAGL